MKTKPYRFKMPTRKYRQGDVVDMRPEHIWTRQRLERGIIQAVAPEKKREKKVVAPKEVKDDESTDH